jgi:hypothetical protein
VSANSYTLQLYVKKNNPHMCKETMKQSHNRNKN